MALRQVRDIEYELQSSNKRKTADIVIERDGRVVVRAPKVFSNDEVDEVVESKRLWIYKSLAEWKDLNACAVVREIASGETFLYLGRSYRLQMVANQREPLMLKEGSFCLSRDLLDSKGQGGAYQAFKDFYLAKGKKRFAERLSVYAPKVGIQLPEVKVKDMGFRWASFGTAGTINFHWKCMMAPLKIIDYIVVHELCHHHHKDHTDAFWNEVDKVMPDWKERKEWLRVNGASLTI